MKYQIHNAVVIGAGTMGAAIAAHLANTGVPVTLLDIVPKDAPAVGADPVSTREARNKIVNDGLERAKKSRPASFFSSDQYALVKTGNLEDDFDVIRQADWVIEVIIENLKLKQDLMARIDAVRKPGAIVSSNTSGIPLKDISAGLSAGFKQHFLGTHFFNPPRYLKLLEIIRTEETLPEVVEFIAHFGEYRLGKGIVLCKDTPNFIGNRLAFGTGAFGLHYILENGYSVDEVDAVTGPTMGHPKTATFRLIDLVGIDVWEHVGKNLAAGIPHDTYAMPYLQDEQVNGLIRTLVEKGWLGNKSKVGFYKEVKTESGKEFWSLNFQTLAHEAPKKVRFESVGKVREIANLGERLKALIKETDRGAALVKTLLLQAFQYGSAIIPEVSDTPKPLDDAIRWGFGHEAGPFEIWDMLGVEETVALMKAEGFAPAAWVEEMLQAGVESFYQYNGDQKVGVYDVSKRAYVPVARPKGVVLLKDQKVIIQNAGATMYDMGDGVACVEFHTKMNALDDDIFELTSGALDRLETDFDGLVVGSEAENFSAGANLFMVVVGAQQGMWETLEGAVKKLQNMNMRMRYSPKPVVMAPAGLALGGGCEVTMHGSRVVAAGELYIGLVELGAGVIPAGGGTKEMLRRLVNPLMRTPGVDALLPLQKVLEQIGQAKVATSAGEARQFGILGPADRIVMNREYLLAEAKKEVLHMVATGYAPPAPEPIYAAGRDALAAIRVALHMYKLAGQVSEYDAHVAGKLGVVMTGGELSRPAWVSEQYILDLEREAFLSLCGEEKTQARMWSLLQTGKPLRN
ncbi:MAG: 3-hydroxyacyl-CoA dehydrogenase/enoyl-CoA hydratase family protein [Chloroflexi bacterium]|nr:MAG: 3-hydroxyacyl-CoA dehydrogenase/enoyl-CoA hydratase family protein [Chloroflexota bacterium]